jgi:hypothetical protein
MTRVSADRTSAAIDAQRRRVTVRARSACFWLKDSISVATRMTASRNASSFSICPSTAAGSDSYDCLAADRRLYILVPASITTGMARFNRPIQKSVILVPIRLWPSRETDTAQRDESALPIHYTTSVDIHFQLRKAYRDRERREVDWNRHSLLQLQQSGGRFEVKGTDERGATIEAAIFCPTFTNIVAEGG